MDLATLLRLRNVERPADGPGWRSPPGAGDGGRLFALCGDKLASVANGPGLALGHGGAQASSSIRAASSKSLSVIPPWEWVESDSVTRFQEIERSG